MRAAGNAIAPRRHSAASPVGTLERFGTVAPRRVVWSARVSPEIHRRQGRARPSDPCCLRSDRAQPNCHVADDPQRLRSVECQRLARHCHWPAQQIAYQRRAISSFSVRLAPSATEWAAEVVQHEVSVALGIVETLKEWGLLRALRADLARPDWLSE